MATDVDAEEDEEWLDMDKTKIKCVNRNNSEEAIQWQNEVLNPMID